MAIYKKPNAVGLLQQPTFRAIEKTLPVITNFLLGNENLKKLLVYSDRHALGGPPVDQKTAMDLLNNQILIVPKLKKDEDKCAYVIIGFDKIAQGFNNDTFRSMTLSFDILCHYDSWLLDDWRIRPYAIAGEIDGMINTLKLEDSGIGEFLAGETIIVNDIYGGLTLYYNVNITGQDRETFTESKNRIFP